MSVATALIVYFSIYLTSIIPIALAENYVAPCFAVALSDFNIFNISILPYYSINSSTLIYPPPTLITSLELIIFAKIYLYPNMYFPIVILVTITLHPFLIIAAPNNASISSPFINLYLTTSVAADIISKTYPLNSRMFVLTN